MLAAGPADWITTPAADEEPGPDHAAERDHGHVATFERLAQPRVAKRLVRHAKLHRCAGHDNHGR
jgi:hypothetical protein